MPNIRERFAIFERDNFTCQYCGRKSPKVELELDHIIPRSLNGTDTISNYATACFDCNRGKSGFRLLQLKLNITSIPIKQKSNVKDEEEIKKWRLLNGNLFSLEEYKYWSHIFGTHRSGVELKKIINDPGNWEKYYTQAERLRRKL